MSLPPNRTVMIEKRTSADYVRSAWSGGATTQLAIFPPDARYADRDFLWRVSSASVELEASDFTPLPDYDRLIATLRGEIVLTHNGGAPVTLKPFRVHAFSGGDATRSLGRCTDFNLMLRRGRAEGGMEALFPDPEGVAFDPGRQGRALLYCAEGSCVAVLDEEQVRLQAGESLLLSPPQRVVLRGDDGPAVVMACLMRVLEEEAHELNRKEP